MLMVQLACPKCGFVIEEYRADQLEADAQKQKRYQYLKKKQALCPSCLTQTTKLEERRVDVEARPETAAPEGAKAVVEAPRAAEAPSPTPPCRRPGTSPPPRCSVRSATSPTGMPTGSSISTAREGTSRFWASPRSSCW